jgi:hypothetical protein
MADDEPKPLGVTVKRALAMTSLSRSTFYKIVAEGRVRTKKVKGRTVVIYRDLERLLEIDDEAAE